MYKAAPEAWHVHEVVKVGRFTIAGMGHRELVASTGEARLVHVQFYILHPNEVERERH